MSLDSLMKSLTDETLIGVWFVAFTSRNEVLAVLSGTFETQFKIVYQVNNHADDVSDFYTSLGPRGATRLVALQHMRDVFDHLCSGPPIRGRWELLRGGRTLAEFDELLQTMPFFSTQLCKQTRERTLQ